MNSRPYSTAPPGRTSWWRKLAVLPAILALFGAPAANAQTMVQVGTGTATNSYFPIYTCYGYNYSQQIYTASEITAAGGFAGSVSKLRFYYNAGGTSTTLWNSWTVYMGNTALDNFASTSGWVPVASMTQVYTGTITPVAGTWLELTLSTPFVYTGGNLVIAVDENTPSYSCTATWRSFTASAAPGPRGLLYYSDGTNPDPASPPTANYNNTTVRSQFQMDITSLSGCTGTTNPGATTGPSSACPGANFSLGITNTTSGSGVNYAWERDNGGGYVPFGTNAAIQTVSQTSATSYRCTVTCSGFGSLTSTPLAVGMNPFLSCYCIPSTNSCTGGDHITNVTFGTINNTSGTCITTATYSDYTAQSTAVGQTANVPIAVTVNNGGTEYAGAWIDYDQSGSFDNTEFIVLNGGVGQGGGVFPGTASIPAGAVLGTTHMRVRSRYAGAIAATDGCTNGWSYGETEDYTVVIGPPPACIAPSVSNSNVTANSADISWTCGGCTGTYYVEYGPSGFSPGLGTAAGGGTLWTGGPVAGGPVTITGLSSTTAYSVYVRQDCGGGNISANTGTSFYTLLDCSAAPTIACGASTVFSVPAGTGVWQLGGTFCAPPGPATSPYCTNGREQVWQFTAPYAGTYVLNTTATSSSYVDYFYKAAPGTCDQTGWTYIDDVYGVQSFNFTIAVPGTYYLLGDPEGTGGATQTFNILCPLPCATPQAPFAQNVTSTTAQVAWTCTGCTGSNFIVEYGPTGFTLGTGTQITSATSPATITGLSVTTPYQAYVYQDCNNVGDGLSNPSSVVSFTTLAPPPVNDLCADAITVTCGSVINSTNNAATSDGLPSQSGTYPLNIETGVWYKYIGDDQQVTLDLCASALDTRVHVFRTTTDCSSLTPFGGNDDNCGTNGWRSFYTFGAITGFTYYIAVDGYGSGYGSFNLTVTCAPLCTPTVANDLCIDRQVLTMGTNCVPSGGNLGCATSTGGANPTCIGGLNTYPDAYFEFVATGTDAYINLAGGANLRFVLYAGTSCATTPEFYCSSVVTSGVPTLVTGLTNGATYTLRVLQPIANAGTFTICVQKLDVSDDPCTPVVLNCGDSRFGRTVGRLNNMPPNACAFNGAASTGGVNYFSYTALADEDVTFSTCGLSTFDSRISVFTGACTALSCNMMNDNALGCGSGSSTVQIRAVTGTTYTVMVHGAGAAEGNYQLIVFCEPYCSGAEANDRCLGAAAAALWTEGDPMAVTSTETLVCSYLDGPTSCSGADGVQGVWYTFTTEPNGSDYDLYLASSVENGLYTAPSLSMALFTGGCTDTGSSGEVVCVASAGGTTQLPPLATSTTYRMLVYNQGGVQEGTFGMLLTHPGFNDAGISAVTTPAGTVCDERFQPVVTLTNYGEAPLSSAQILSRIDGGLVQTYNWSGPALATGASTTVTLPLVTSPGGLHTFTAEVVLANGQADALAANSSTSSSYDATGQTVKVVVRMDNNAAQTSWAIADLFGFPLAIGGPYTALDNNQVIETSVCLETTFGNCFYFYVYDAAGDGIVNGYWELRDTQGRNVLQDNGVFGAQSPSLTPASAIYTAHEFCLPLGPSPIQAAECGVFNNYLNNKVYTTAVGGAVSYQFEFSDPNAGFYRRITLPRNWVKFGEMVSTPLVYGTTYYCRARADQGAAGFADDFYGAGCEMALDASQPVCTELISTPGATLSCGATKRFNGSDKVWAIPVTYATEYRFSFTGMIDPDGPNPNLATDVVGTPNFNDPPVMSTRTILRTSYVCPLSWSTYQLVSGNTYQVSAECKVGGVWSGYCGAVCPLTIQNPPGMMLEHGGNTAQRIGEEELANVALWPNPARDGRVNITINELVDETQMISVDMFDVFGKRVMAEQFENSGSVFNHVLDLDGSIAAGSYMVRITVNNEVFVERLNVVR